MRQIFLLLALSFGLLYTPETNAQLFSRNKALENELPPNAILVQINANQRKKEALSRSKNKSLLNQLIADTDSIRERMIMDFEDNFSYCPVYYFIDTNASLILEQKFPGVLLNENLEPEKNISFKPDQEYFIVAFAVPVPLVKKDDQLRKDDPYATGHNYTGKKRLVVMDKTMTMLSKPLPDGSNNTRGGSMKKSPAAYKYTSPKFDMYYRPSAKGLSAKLEAFYGPYQHK